MFVKICGITNPADAESAIAAGADALGFNFWPGSERYIEPDKAAEWISELPDSVSRVAVLVNPPLAYAKEIAGVGRIDLLQLHGTESPDFCLSLVEAQVPLWKAIPMAGLEVPLHDFHTNRLLLDKGVGANFGGTGTSFPWGWASALIAAKPALEFILAGGLTPENVAEAVNRAQPFGVYVASAVEIRPGHKDIYRVRDLLSLRARSEAVRKGPFQGRKQPREAGLLPALTPLALTKLALLLCQLSLTN